MVEQGEFDPSGEFNGEESKGKLRDPSALSRLSLTLSDFLRLGVILVGGIFLIVKCTNEVPATVPHLMNYLRGYQGALPTSMADGSGAEYSVKSVEVPGAFAPQKSMEVPIYIKRSTGELLSQPDPNLGDKSHLQLLQELGYKPQQIEDIWVRRILVTGLEGHLQTRLPVPTTAEAQEKYQPYQKYLEIGPLKGDYYSNAFAIFTLLDMEKDLVQFILLTDRHDRTANEVGVLETAWMPLAQGFRDGTIKYDSGVSATSQKLYRILQGLTVSAFSDDGSIDYGNGVIGPSLADQERFNK